MPDQSTCSHDAPGQESERYCIRCGKDLGAPAKAAPAAKKASPVKDDEKVSE